MSEEMIETWQEALNRFFRRKNGNWVVDREEVKKYNFDRNLPIHVGEFLFSYENEDKKFTLAHKKILEDKILRFHPKSDEITGFKHDLITKGSHKLLDFLDVDINVQSNEHFADLKHIGEPAKINREVIDKHPDILKRPMWGLITLDYHSPKGQSSNTRRVNPAEIWITDFIPIETTKISLNAVWSAFVGIVKASPSNGISLWHQTLLATLNVDPESIDLTNAEGFTQFLNHISRLVPLAQESTFLIEMGPPGTGKTTAVGRSPYSMAVAARATSVARVFFNNNTKKTGCIVGLDYLAFDDIQDPKGWEKINDMNTSLLQFMNPSTIGVVRFPPHCDQRSGCSIAFLGNTKGGNILTDPSQYYSNVPGEMRREQFLDRITGFIDGHSFSKFGTPWSGLALQGDIFGRFLYELRRNREITIDFGKWFDAEYVKYENISARCEYAIKNLATGILKILFPSYDKIKGTGRGMDQPPKELLAAILNHAVFLRGNIRSLISKSGVYQPDQTADYRKPIKYSEKWK